jgi:soluble lytic murein transglycosylase-like protein
MQVMPFHAGRWGCASVDLTDLETNVCHGSRILADALRRFDGDVERALLYYNGCVRGSNTPDCHLYPSRVLALAATPHASAAFRGAEASAMHTGRRD